MELNKDTADSKSKIKGYGGIMMCEDHAFMKNNTDAVDKILTYILKKQNDTSRKELESIFYVSTGEVDTTTLDGLLKDYVDENQNSQEAVRSVRDEA